MILAGTINESYLSKSKVCSLVGSHLLLSKNSSDLPNNEDVLKVDQIIKSVMSSAAESKIGNLYINFRKAIPARHMLIAMGHPQPPTPMQTGNTTSLRFVNNTIAPRRTKSMDMRLHWLILRKAQQIFCQLLATWDDQQW